MATDASLNSVTSLNIHPVSIEALHVSLDGQFGRCVDDLSVDGFTVVGGIPVPPGTFLHASFTVARCLSITIPVMAGAVTADAFGDPLQAFRFAATDPSLVDLLIVTAPSVVVH
jgi:hypothetical protein